MPISYTKIQSCFDGTVWDIGFLSIEAIKNCLYTPIKLVQHAVGINLTNTVHTDTNITNGIILAKEGHSWDYTLYEEAALILANKKINGWNIIYTNYKRAAVLGGIGVQARNSLVYNYKFGFDCHYVAVMFDDEIIDVPDNLRVNHKLWHRCEGCDDCVKACPVGAIHGTEEPYWLDSSACDNFIGYGHPDRPEVPSIKDFWYQATQPDVSEDEIRKIKNRTEWQNKFGTPAFKWSNGYVYDGHNLKKDGVPIPVDTCRECTSQPRCSKWNGKYPYGNIPKISHYGEKEVIIPLSKLIAKDKSKPGLY